MKNKKQKKYKNNNENHHNVCITCKTISGSDTK